MPKGSAWINFIYINVGFILQIFVMYFFARVKEIKDNWPKYRCNPMYMPLSDNIGSDFVYCVQSMQTNFMGYLLQPITAILAGLGDMSFDFLGNIGDIREMFSYIRDQIANIIGGVFGVFSNIAVEFQKITVGVKDIIGKVVGITATIMYMIDGSMKTIQSMWAGPPGQMVQTMGSCFHPYTKVKLQNGTVVQMKDIHLGDILDNGSRVRASMRIENSGKDEYYVYRGAGVDGDDIYVTGLHMVQGSDGKYIHVKDDVKAVKCPLVKTEWFSCLITDNHKIQLGKHTFWDWEDYLLSH